MNSSPFKSSLFWVSLVVLATAAWLWNGRVERRHELRLARQENQSQQDAQRAAALLFRAFRADNYLTYSALSKTTARMGKTTMASTARVVHAPSRLSIVYVQGDHAGLHSGYNEQWAWRQVNALQPMIPYAEMERPAIDMAARRFALLLQNYEAVRQGKTRLGVREVEVIELRPFYPVDGAQGPVKKLWIDTKTGLTLRLQTFNYRLMPVMESVLSEVNLAPKISDETFVPPQKLQQIAKIRPWMVQDAGDDLQSVAKQTGVYPPQPDVKSLPAGFEFDSVGAHRCTACADNAKPPCYAALSRYTDGLNTLTLFALSPDCVHMNASDISASESTLASKDVRSSNLNSSLNSSKPTDSSAMLASSEETQACDFGTGTLAMRSTKNGQLIAVSDLPAPVLHRVLQATSVRLYNSSSN